MGATLDGGAERRGVRLLVEVDEDVRVGMLQSVDQPAELRRMMVRENEKSRLDVEPPSNDGVWLTDTARRCQ